MCTGPTDEQETQTSAGLIRGLWRAPKPLLYSAFTVDAGIACIGLALQFLGISMGASPLVLGLFGTLGTLGYTVSCLFSGRISDRFGRKRSAFGGIALCSVVWFLYPFAPNPYVILAMVPVGGLGLALFWPSVQAWLVELTKGGRAALTHNIGLFNLFWSSGVMLGPVLAGQTWAMGRTVPFFLSTGLIVLVMIALLLTPRGRQPAEDEYDRSKTSGHDVDPGMWTLFMRLAWYGLFGNWFLGATMRTMFPKLASTIGIGEQTVGWIMTIYYLAVLITFAAAWVTDRWQFRLSPLIAAEVLAMVGMVGAGLTTSASLFAVSFAVGGVAGGLSYVSSLYYSVHGPTRSRGKRTGLHEAILGSGALFGSLVGGIVAEYIHLRAPYFTVIVVLAGIIILQLLTYVRGRKSRGEIAA